MYLKLWLMIALIVIGMAGYTTVEYLERQRSRRGQQPGAAPLPNLPEVRLDSDWQRTSF